MSSNMYGFEYSFHWNGREYFTKILVVGAHEDDLNSQERIMYSWETTKPFELAQWELKHCDWTKRYPNHKRIFVWDVNAYWLDTDTEQPPIPTDKEVLEILANDYKLDPVWEWDT